MAKEDILPVRAQRCNRQQKSWVVLFRPNVRCAHDPPERCCANYAADLLIWKHQKSGGVGGRGVKKSFLG